MRRTAPLTVLAAVDPDVRDLTTMTALLDVPRSVAVRHDFVPTSDGVGLRRVVMTAADVLADELVALEHPCASCAVREDAIPTLTRVSEELDPSMVLLCLPVGGDSLPAVRTLAPHLQSGGRLERLRLGTVAVSVDPRTAIEDLLGDDLLADRPSTTAPGDRRAVGEALAAMLAHADLVLPTDEPDARTSHLLDHLRAADGSRIDGLTGVASRLLEGRHDPVIGEARTDPRRVAPGRRPSGAGVWTLDLHSRRPFHPERLLARIEDLGGGRVRSRGVFWVPSRPDSACAWDGSGGQLSIGDIGPWGLSAPRTRLVMTGMGEEAPLLERAFQHALLDDTEWAAGLAPWLGREDVLAPWLGARQPCT